VGAIASDFENIKISHVTGNPARILPLQWLTENQGHHFFVTSSMTAQGSD
jgi:hypothetical protein